MSKLFSFVKSYGLIFIAVIFVFLSIILSFSKGGFAGFGSSNIDGQIEKWIAKNPEKIIESVVAYQSGKAGKGQAGSSEDGKKFLKENGDKIYENSSLPSFSLGKHDIVIVEFFDYMCGYCKRAHSVVDEFVNSDKKAKVIFIEYPILSELSKQIAEISVGVHLLNPKKYYEFHSLLMKDQVKDVESVYGIAKKSGIDIGKLKVLVKDQSAKIAEILKANAEIAQNLSINGTPAFIIGDQILPGFMEKEGFAEAVKQARGK